jgi:glyoxalase family protein
MTVTGIHHITLACKNAQRTVDFYTRVLGQRLVKKTVNFDDPGSYHLYFGDPKGKPGSIITFFEWPHLAKGQPGIGGTHHFAIEVESYAGLLRWKRRLTDLGLRVEGPLDRHYFVSIYFRDPDGVILEIATRGPGFTRDEEPAHLGEVYRPPPEEMLIQNREVERIEAETWPEPVPEIVPEMALQHGLHHITAIGADIERTHAFYGDLIGLRLVKRTSNFDDPESAHWYWGVGEGTPGSLITYFERNPAREPRAQIGTGQTHHFALSVPDEDSQLEWRERLIGAGLNVSPVMDRVYFKSIYTSDPDGHIFELATAGPGFTADEGLETLGKALKLPPWFESHRGEIEAVLTPIQ